ncbi:Na+/H+ antiporter subunit D [Saccharothrix isguenensis]
MNAALLAVPVLVPLFAAGLSLGFARHAAVQRALGIGVLVLVLADAGVVLAVADGRGPFAVAVGGWSPPVGIPLVADRLSALLLVVSVLVALAVLVFAVGQGVADARRTLTPVFHPTYLVLVAGVALAFLAGDLFTLFVAFEVMLAASYVLITLRATEHRARAGMTYTITSLASSLLFLTAIALVYAATGTVNLADLGSKAALVPDGLRDALSLLLLVVFGIKAAMVPLHFWLPDSYPTAPAPITAVLAALLTKVGVYAMVRTQTLVFPRQDVWPLLGGIAIAALLVGILGAIAQDDLNRLLAFTLVSHIGFMLFGLALSDAAGLTGTIMYIVHHITVQATLFLVAGLIVRGTGTPSLRRMGGLARLDPWVAVLFFIPAMSLAGIPPLSGFVAKFALLRAGVAEGGTTALALAAAAVLTSLLTLYAMARLWSAVFWGPSRDPVPDPDPTDELDVGTGQKSVPMLGATAAMVATGLALAVLAGPLAGVSGRAAADLLDREVYRVAVLGEEGR